jgi:type IV pilus assembly protein PilE
MKGWSLLELMIVLAIIGILLILSVPRFEIYFAQAHRDQAKTILSQVALALENYQFIHQSYEGATFSNLQMPSIEHEKYYRYALNASENSYTITATLMSDSNDACGVLTLNSDNVHEPVGCW